MIEERSWVFNARVPTEDDEVVCLIGSCPELGEWDPCKLIPLTRNEALQPEEYVTDKNNSVWSTTLQLPQEQVGYRYCVAVSATMDNHDQFIIKKWETHFRPRCIVANVFQEEKDKCNIATFGEVWGQTRIEAGWLVQDYAVQLKLSTSNINGDPIVMWKKKYKNKQVRVKVTPIQNSSESGHYHEDTTDLGDSRPHETKNPWPFMEVAVLKEEECQFKKQGQFGILFSDADFTVFQCRTLDVSTTAYMFDFYLEGGTGEIPLFIGSSYVLPSVLVDNFGITILPITSPKHQAVGQLKVQYLVVKPMPLGYSDMSVSFARYWKDSWKGLEVGHRGAGNSYHSQPKSCANIRENTVASLKYAADSGADMVEIDVQLSKDLVPVIYHDFHACIALKRKKDQDHSDLLEIPIKDLTVEQLHALKDLSYLKERTPEDIFSYCDAEDMLYHVKEKGLSKFSDDELEDHQPFPTLVRALNVVPTTCGFNIEVKWTMLLKDGSYELQHPFELNHFLDLILEAVLKHAASRKIVFSSFHPDICTMLRLKQNRYPVLFLTQGVSQIWPPYDDIRTQSTKQAFAYAKTADILGVNLHTEELLKDPSLMDSALNNQLVVFCWGDDNNDKSTISFLKKLGMHAIVYDKIDVYNSKSSKESVFLCDECDTLKEEMDSSSPSSSCSSNASSSNASSPKAAECTLPSSSPTQLL